MDNALDMDDPKLDAAPPVNIVEDAVLENLGYHQGFQPHNDIMRPLTETHRIETVLWPTGNGGIHFQYHHKACPVVSTS